MRLLYRLHRSRADLTMEPKPYQQFEAEGYALSDGGGDSGFKLPGGLQDLNGDGRQDLVTMSLDFSMLQAVKIMTVQRIGIRLDFHVWCQAGEAGGRKPGLPDTVDFGVDREINSRAQISFFKDRVLLC